MSRERRGWYEDTWDHSSLQLPDHVVPQHLKLLSADLRSGAVELIMSKFDCGEARCIGAHLAQRLGLRHANAVDFVTKFHCCAGYVGMVEANRLLELFFPHGTRGFGPLEWKAITREDAADAIDRHLSGEDAWLWPLRRAA